MERKDRDRMCMWEEGVRLGSATSHRMKIAHIPVGPDAPLFLVAELGITAHGSVDRALSLIDAVAKAGADAAKFIVTDPDKVMSRRDVPFTYDTLDGPVTRPLYDLLQPVKYTPGEWLLIKEACESRGLVFFATADHLEGVELLEAVGTSAYKLSAWDIAYQPLLAAMRATGKPILIDVATATREEVIQAMPKERDDQVLFVHAPHPPDWQMSRLTRGFFRHDYPVGFASPNRENWCDYLALGGGVCLIEKRLTLRRDETQGHHHAVSLEPDEFSEWVRSMRLVDARRREDPFGGSPEAWAMRRQFDRGPDGRQP